MERSRRRVWIEAASAAAAAVLFGVTLLWPAWIEAVTGLDPDHSSGLLEWSVVFGFAACTISLSLLARYEWRKQQPE